MKSDILGALTCLLKTLKETDKLSSMPLVEWPTYAATLKKCTEDNGSTIYQYQQLKKYSEALRYYASQYEEYCSRVSQCIKSRLSWSDLQLMRDIIFVFALHGWEKLIEDNNDMAAIDRLVERFASPLEGAQADINLMKTEFTDMIGYTVQYISLSSIDYHSVWWRLFNAPNSAEWSTILVLDELLFSLPASIGKLERIFSLLGTIKVEKRSRLTNESLNDLLLLKSDKTPLSNFNPDPSIDLWLSAKSRGPSQKKIKEYRQRRSDGPSSSQALEDSSDSEAEDTLRLWDKLICKESDSN